MKNGFTLIELLIGLAITGLLIGFGASAYKQAQIRQALYADIETFTGVLQGAKKEAVIGDKDCTGPLVGVEVTFLANSTKITTQAICQDTSGAIITTNLAVAEPSTSGSFRFLPLNGSTTLGSAGLSIVFTTASNLTSHITITQPGAITHVTP